MTKETELYLLNKIKLLEEENKTLLAKNLELQTENSRSMIMKFPALKPGEYKFIVEDDGKWSVCTIANKETPKDE